jgi:hypothetical protein
MRIRCIKLQEQGVDFFVALVKEDVVNSTSEANHTIAQFEKFLHAPVVLCGDVSGKYFGRKDLVDFLVKTLHPSRIQWGVHELSLPPPRVVGG